MSRRLAFLRLPTTALAAVTLALPGCSKKATRAISDAPVPVEVATVEAQTVPVELHAIGTVEPIATVQLKSKVQGEITRVFFSDGAYVKAGEPLFTIDPRPFELTLRRAEADLAQAQTEAKNAQDQADRYTKLNSQGVASKEQYAQYLTTAAAQKSVLAARQSDVDQARLSYEWTTVRAPISGRAGAALLKAGNIVQANTDVLTVINQTQPIYVSFALPETQLAEVRSWMSKTAVEVSAIDSTSGRVLGSGWLDFVDNVVDRQSGMITLKATFPNADESLWPGQFVDVVVKLTEEKDVLVIPSTAVMEGQNGSQVFVVNNGLASLRKIEVERAFGPQSVVGSGLKAGETVISSGQLRVSNGGKVVVSNAPAPDRRP